MEIDTSTISLLISLTGLALAVGGPIGAYYRARLQDREDLTKLEVLQQSMKATVDNNSVLIQGLDARVDNLCIQVRDLQTKMDVFWTNASKDLAKFIHSPHTPELDVLLERYTVDGEPPMSLQELEKLRGLLIDKVAGGEDTKDKILATVLLIHCIDQRIFTKVKAEVGSAKLVCRELIRPNP